MPEIFTAREIHDGHEARRPGKRVLPRLLFAAAIGFLGLVSLCVNWPCLPLWFGKGVYVSECPIGTPVPTVTIAATNLRRGAEGSVHVTAGAAYSLGSPDQVQSASLGRFSPELALVDEAGNALDLEPVKRWKTEHRGTKVAPVVLPAVPDGDYKLRATVDTPLGEVTVDAPLAIYAPAIAHVLTDRPLYKPGQTIRFRAVLLRMADLTPIEQRPGTFKVLGPSGDVLLEERVPVGAWGVAASDLPLADGADVGSYTVQYLSGAASDSVAVRVEPFVLPRFEIQATATQPWYKIGEKPTIEGTIRYRSGAPVAAADVELKLGANQGPKPRGAVVPDPVPWPPPSDWTKPFATKTDEDGAFALALSVVPSDLRGIARFPVRITAVDAAGERIAGSAEILLSADPIMASVESELSDGLVPDFNNRVYVRVTTPDGTPLPGAAVTVARAWDVSDEGTIALADEDAVAALQIDPGQPVSVVIPPVPVRPMAPSEQRRVTLDAIDELLSADGVGAEESLVLQGWTPSLEHCAVFQEKTTDSFDVLVDVAADGTVRRAMDKGGVVDRCLTDGIRSLKGPHGRERLYVLSFKVSAVEGASLLLDVQGFPSVPPALTTVLTRAAQESRPCIVDRTAAEVFGPALRWHVNRGSGTVAISWLPGSRFGQVLPNAVSGCVRSRFAGLKLDEADPKSFPEAEGVVTLSLAASAGKDEQKPSATVHTAWELSVSARKNDESLGTTKVILNPGSVPALRLRPEEPVLRPGATLSLKPLRGPDFSGDLPSDEQKIALLQGGEKIGELLYDPKSHLIQGKVPEKASGLLSVEWMGARAVLLVPRENMLSIELKPDRESYRPGDRAKLGILTRSGSAPVEAGVTLAGVDEALGQIASLVGPDDFGRTTVRAALSGPAFGIYDARALLMGRIRGSNALLATLLRVGDIPRAASLEEGSNAAGQTILDPSVPLTEVFYEVLADARGKVAAWEEGAPEGEILSAKRMVGFWEDALEARKKDGKPVSDAYGETVHLKRLPADLLALADPRGMVSNARRLPEDVENWSQYVAKEAP